MRRTLTSALPHATAGQQVLLEGWVHRRRELAKVTFLVVRDRSGLAQVVLPAGTPVPPEETTVSVTGVATPNEQAPGGVELTEATVTALTEPAETPPFELWRPSLTAGLPAQLDHSPVSWRHPAQRAKWELAAASLRGFRSTLDGLGFTEVMHPAPTFAMLTRGDLRLVLSAPGGGPGGGQAMADGTVPTPGGWNRFAIEVDDLDRLVAELRSSGVRFRNDVVDGVGGRQTIAEDPSGNPVELFEPKIDEARLST